MELVTRYLQKRYLPNKSSNVKWPYNLLPKHQYQNDFWVTKENECVYPSQMSNRHLINTIKMIHRNAPYIFEHYDEMKADRFILYGILNSSILKQLSVSIKKEDRKFYNKLWENYRIYMLLRQEIVCRGLEKHIES